MASISFTNLAKRSLAMLGVFGEGQTLESYQGEQARLTINNMFEQWNLEGLTVYNHFTASFPTVAGTASYTIGTGGDINTARPMQIDRMYIRDNGTDYAIEEISYQDYAELSDKSTQSSLPYAFYYETQFTLGRIYLYPVPSAVKTVYYVTPKPFTAVSSMSDSVSYPDGYGKAIEMNLAVELSVFYPGRMSGELAVKAKEAKDSLIRLNAVKRIPQMRVDSECIGRDDYYLVDGENA